jgi:hypothetical protein
MWKWRTETEILGDNGDRDPEIVVDLDMKDGK